MSRDTNNSRSSKTVDDFFQDGITLFNGGKYFDSHEAWEECWKIAEGKDKEFYHGLIFVAAAYVHYERGNKHGIHVMMERAKKKLEQFLPEYKGVDIEKILNMPFHNS